MRISTLESGPSRIGGQDETREMDTKKECKILIVNYRRVFKWSGYFLAV